MKPLTLLVVFILTVIAPASHAQGSRTASASDFPPPDSPFQPDLTPGYVLIEGDIQVPLSHFKRLTEGGIQAASTFGGDVSFWPNKTVPYDFVTTGTGAVSAANQTLAINAMNAIAARAGVIFRAAVGSDDNWIRFQNSAFNNSAVGLQGGPQIINIGSWGNQIIICHEIFHSLGFWHEQSRPDRGTFVTINETNVCGSDVSTACTDGTATNQCCMCVNAAGTCIPCNFNFRVEPGTGTYGPYDFDSFMHYGRASFSCSGADTITVNGPWNAQWQGAIGQRDHFSYYDALTCRALYPFPGDRWLDRTDGGSATGEFLQPYRNTTLAGALTGVPSGGTLFVKFANSYSGVGIHSKPVTIVAPNGVVTFGN